VARSFSNCTGDTSPLETIRSSAIFAPICEVWVSRAQVWNPHLAGTLKFDENPAPELIRDPIAAYFAARSQ
jgi:hypothetical protein